jgi:hypothetical protein
VHYQRKIYIKKYILFLEKLSLFFRYHVNKIDGMNKNNCPSCINNKIMVKKRVIESYTLEDKIIMHVAIAPKISNLPKSIQ